MTGAGLPPPPPQPQSQSQSQSQPQPHHPQDRRASSSPGDTSVASVYSAMEQRTGRGTGPDDAPATAPTTTTTAAAGPEAGDSSRALIGGPGDARESRRARLSELAIETPPLGPLAGDAGREFLCLCTPAPKVPRPRNAFILYRQHHQAQVVSEHPGLANPDISKIIGEQWRQQPDNVKAGWKKLAEEEKVRHQQQYPDYRYQPRRGQRPTGRPGTAAGEDSGRCPKCGGRYISTPRTPQTPVLTPTAAKPAMNPYQARDGRAYEGESSRQALPQGRQMNPYGQGHPGEMDESWDLASPAVDAKRRRFNTTGHYQGMSSPNPYQGHQPSRHSRQASAAGPSSAGHGYGPAPLPGPPGMGQPGQGPMPPPPRPPHSQHFPGQGPGRNPNYDESLRLPPLQTQMTPKTPAGQGESDRPGADPLGLGMAVTNPGDNQARSTEAVVMNISFQSKLNVLRKISPPLAPSGFASPGAETRGAVIAIEGPDERLLEQVDAALQRGLSEAQVINLQCWRDDSSTIGKTEDVVVAEGSSSAGSSRKSSVEGVALSDMYVEYMQKLSQWHGKSKQMVKHITTRSEQQQRPVPVRRASEGEVSTPREESSSPSMIPVALVTGGYSATIADRYACRVPIVDSYAPVDHWQWMATLWRGVVGADLVVYVKASAEDEVARLGMLDFVDSGIMLLRIAPGKGLDDRSSRRLSFEVIDWLCSGNYRKESAGVS
ncbi:hypothetical protein VD0004_g6323 [Verticillium dahliae]|nr:hypothetical protein VD0004_g6323 [Verticillium dahliae]PNH71257.1 hypothetical protein VD0001_g6279 [Verticillium dahliae]